MLSIFSEHIFLISSPNFQSKDCGFIKQFVLPYDYKRGWHFHKGSAMDTDNKVSDKTSETTRGFNSN